MPDKHAGCTTAFAPLVFCDAVQDSPAPTPGRVDAAFVELLHSDKADMQLMRLIQKTGIGASPAEAVLLQLQAQRWLV